MLWLANKLAECNATDKLTETTKSKDEFCLNRKPYRGGCLMESPTIFHFEDYQ